MRKVNLELMLHLGAIQKCQHFHECTNYIFSDPLPPPLQVYSPTFLVSKICVSRITFIVQQQKINPYFKPVWYVTSDRFG